MSTFTEFNLRALQKLMHLILAVLSAVTGYFTYLGAAKIMDPSGSSWQDQASAAIFSVGVTAGIYIFWRCALWAVPDMPDRKTRILGMIITAVGCLFLVCLSCWMNVTALAGSGALELHMNEALPSFERSLDAGYRRAQLPSKLLPDLGAAAEKYCNLAEAERAHGRISGVSGDGGVADTLKGVCDQIRGVIAQIESAGKNAETPAAKGRESLERMRRIGSGDEPIDRRLRDFAGEADRFRASLTELSSQGLLEGVQRTMNGLAGGLIERVTSRNETVASAQSEAAAKIRVDLEKTGGSIAAIAADIAAAPQPGVPVFERIGVVQAVLIHAGSLVPYWAGGIALDLLPTLLILYLMLVASVRNRVSAVRSNSGDVTVAELLRAGEAMQLLGELQRKRNFVNAALGDANGPEEGEGRS